jgi:UDPglucose--hexose-1-phosphate uridylyltransferase
MADMRRDPIIGRWVIVSDPKESWGPEVYEKEQRKRDQGNICQFCPGREGFTPAEVDAIRFDGSPANQPGWLARVVPNKFPALRIEGQLDKRADGVYDLSNGIGAHEVLLETSDHTRDLADLSVEQIGYVIRLCQNRFINLANDRRFKYIMVFKNYGESAGASVEHAHSQIIALPLVPKNVQEELDGSLAYYKYRGHCVYCDIIAQENQEAERIVAQNDAFIGFCPFVPRYPFECWIMPKEHSSVFNHLSDNDRRLLAAILREMLSRLKVTLSDPSYNFYLHVPPVNYSDLQSYHWHIEILPQLTRVAGFEWGTGFYVIRTDPGVAAQYLKKAQIP